MNSIVCPEVSVNHCGQIVVVSQSEFKFLW